MEKQKSSPPKSPTTFNPPKPTSAATNSTLILSTSEIVAFAVQCDNCHKWRKVAREENFEEFRCNQTEDPFVCNKLPGITCEKPADISYDSSLVWVMDKPNIPKTPIGFKRVASLRSDYSKMDVQYLTPEGKKIRASPGMVDYLQERPEFSHLSPSDFCFTAPKIMRDTVPKHVVKKLGSSTKKRSGSKR